MSCSKWRWTEECDGQPCVGDCDLCDFYPEEDYEDDEDDELQEDDARG